MVELLGINEGYCDCQNCHDDGDRKPGIVGLEAGTERDHHDGKISWDCDKRCTERFRFYFEFHSILGVSPPGIKKINQYVEAIVKWINHLADLTLEIEILINL
jgi:hypothetical protein